MPYCRRITRAILACSLSTGKLKLPEGRGIFNHRSNTFSVQATRYCWDGTLGHVDQQDHLLGELCRNGGNVVGEVEVRVQHDSKMMVGRYIRHVISLHTQVRVG